MTWYAIRTMPGAQMPQREYAVETTSLGADGRPRGKGYRIVPSLNADISAVERALKDAGFAYYMPVERRVVRDRKKAHTYTTRRFALLLGYVFVEDVEDWRTLGAVPGVAGIVGIRGKPLAVRQEDILLLQEAEAWAEKRCRAQLERIEEASQRLTRNRRMGKFPVGSTIHIVKGTAKGKLATVVGSDRDGRLKAIISGLDSMGTVSFTTDVVELIDAA